MTEKEISTAIASNGFPGLKKAIDNELKDQANRFTAIIFIVSVIIIASFSLITYGIQSNYQVKELVNKNLLETLTKNCLSKCDSATTSNAININIAKK